MKKVGYILLKALLWLLSRLPLRVHYAFGRAVSFLAEKVFRYRYDVVMINLSRSFPKKKYSEIREIAHKFYRHFGELVSETVWFGGCTDPARLKKQRILEVENPEALQALFESSPSVMVMYSHCGNWELLGGVDSYNYTGTPYPVSEKNFCVVYRKMHSRVWDRILKENRFAPVLDKEAFDGYIESKNIVRYVFSHREEKKIYNINTDQRPYFKGSDTLPVRFMNQDCETMTAAATLARKFHMGVAFLSQENDRRGHYTMKYETICTDASEMTPQQIMDEYYSLLQREIEAQPWNYLWTHKRWPNK